MFWHSAKTSCSVLILLVHLLFSLHFERMYARMYCMDAHHYGQLLCTLVNHLFTGFRFVVFIMIIFSLWELKPIPFVVSAAHSGEAALSSTGGVVASRTRPRLFLMCGSTTTSGWHIIHARYIIFSFCSAALRVWLHRAQRHHAGICMSCVALRKFAPA